MKSKLRIITLGLIIFVTFFNGIDARELSVKSFEVLPMDITARTKGRKDLNGVLCAALRVALPVEGCKFEGSVIDSNFDTNGYVVYVTHGTKMLRINCPGCESFYMVFANHSQISSVESGVTYELKLSGYEEPATSKKVDPGANFLVMTIDPPQAEGISVKIDGQSEPVNKGQVSKYLHYGEHTYEVEAIGYAPVSGTASVQPNDKTRVQVRLNSIMAELAIETQTKDSEIILNGERKGTGKWKGKLQPGLYRVDVQKQGYKPFSQSISLDKNEVKTMLVPELAAILGGVSIDYSPIDADVLIDGNNVGQTPIVLKDLIVGQHKIVLRKQGYEDYNGTFTVAEGKITELKGSLSTAKTVAKETKVPEKKSEIDYPVSGEINGYDYVDLGLPSGTLWATSDVGANSIGEVGQYFAWGNPVPLDFNAKGFSFVKQENKNKKLANEIINKKGITNISGMPEYDAATANWGGTWRMPTFGEIAELVNNCTVWKVDNKILVMGPNGKSIFFPKRIDDFSWGWYLGSTYFPAHVENFDKQSGKYKKNHKEKVDVLEISFWKSKITCTDFPFYANYFYVRAVSSPLNK